MSNQKGFTLVELLVVITIIAILTAIGIVIYTGLNQRVRDAVRLADLASIQQALLIVSHDKNKFTTILCFEIDYPCQDSSYPLNDTTRRTDGTGWIKVNFDQSNTVSFTQLPIDPLNNIDHQYLYYSDGNNWRIETTLESTQYQGLMQKDGGLNPQKYEVSSKFLH
jgi:prepilin-type N-terminal cleavage/methylation domain-containing protein